MYSTLPTAPIHLQPPSRTEAATLAAILRTLTEQELSLLYRTATRRTEQNAVLVELARRKAEQVS